MEVDVMFFDAIACFAFAFCLVALILFCHRAGQYYKASNEYGELWVQERFGTVMKISIVMVVSGCWLIWGEA